MIRLAGGKINGEGRVEACIDGQWGTICDKMWTDSDASVVCRQIGHNSTGNVNKIF